MLRWLTVQTHRQSEFVDITPQVQQAVRDSGIGDGVVYVYCPHTTCGLTIQENADPGVQHDILLLLNRLAPLPGVGQRRLADAARVSIRRLLPIHNLCTIQPCRN
jgi:secondary thiamine-phosphate synthase enzyme